MAALAFGIYNVGKASLKAAGEFEQAKVSFEVMLGDAEKAKVLLGELQRFADQSPFAMQGLADNAKTLLSFGVELQELMPTLKMLGDVSVGNEQKMQQMTLAFAQASSTGRLMGQDLLQMVNAGFNPLQEISKRTGKSMKDLKKDMENGSISIGMVKQAFIDATSEGGRFYGMTQKQADTIVGKTSTMKDGFMSLARTIGNDLAPAAKAALDYIIKLTGQANELLIKLIRMREMAKEKNASNYIDINTQKYLDAKKVLSNPKLKVGDPEADQAYSDMQTAKSNLIKLNKERKATEKILRDLTAPTSTTAGKMSFGGGGGDDKKPKKDKAADAYRDQLNNIQTEQHILNLKNQYRKQAADLGIDIENKYYLEVEALALEKAAKIREIEISDAKNKGDLKNRIDALYLKKGEELTLEIKKKYAEDIRQEENNRGQEILRAYQEDQQRLKQNLDTKLNLIRQYEQERIVIQNSNEVEQFLINQGYSKESSRFGGLKGLYEEYRLREKEINDTALTESDKLQAKEELNKTFNVKLQDLTRKANEESAEKFKEIWGRAYNDLFSKQRNFAEIAKKLMLDLAMHYAKIGLENFATGAGKGSAWGKAANIGLKAFSLLGFANGGTPPVGKISLVGEKGPELFVPKQSGRVIPNDQISMGGDQQPITVINAPQIKTGASKEDVLSALSQSNKELASIIINLKKNDVNGFRTAMRS